MTPRCVTWPAGRPRDWVITDTAGSLLAWLEYPGQRPDRPELVVYDSDSRVVLDRRPIEVPDRGSATDPRPRRSSGLPGVEEPGGSPACSAPAPVRRGHRSARTRRRGRRRGRTPRRQPRPGRRPLGRGRRGAPHWERETLARGHQLGRAGSRCNDGRARGPRRSAHWRAGRDSAYPAGYESSQMWFLQWLDDTRFTLISVIPGRYGNWPGARYERGAWAQPGRASDATEERSRASASKPGEMRRAANKQRAPGRKAGGSVHFSALRRWGACRGSRPSSCERGACGRSCPWCSS